MRAPGRRSAATVRPDVLVVLPTYEEAENLPRIIPVILDQRVQVLVVDDASPDGTGTVADELAKQHSGVSVLHRERKQGLGPAYAAGFAVGLERGATWLGSMDADGSHDPEDLSRLLDRATDADLVVGSRYIPGGATPDWPWRRRFLSRNGNRYARFMLGLRPRDVTGGFRVYRAAVMRDLRPETCRAAGYGFQIEMLRRAVDLGARIEEVPIVFRDRQRGKSKMSGSIVAEAMALVTKWGLRRWWAKLPGVREPR